MDELKPWYLSRTIWASLISFAIAASGLVGIRATGVDHAMLTDSVVELLTAGASIIAIVGRLRATTRIG